jgi:hypothetical protein
MLERLGTWMILRHLLTESAGIFWLWAEILILYAVCTARRGLRSGDLSGVQHLVPLLSGRIRWILAMLLIASMALLARHAFFLQWLRTNARDAAASGQDVLLPGLARLDQQHILLWSAFVVMWVFLECAIVWQGWRVYCVMRAQLRPDPAA